MTDPIVAGFRQYFLDLHGNPPFPWQERLVAKVCASGWPGVIDLPTGSGKTACLDVAVYAMAYGAESMPRRVFFVVDRRVVVSEAHLRMQTIASGLAKPKTASLERVAQRLLELAQAGAEFPLEVYQLRGGAYRDESWVRTPLQPTLVASTVDQVGSRLLFRGYGINPHTAPIHAGLIANDALVFLDEAHCSKAFAETLQAVERYRGPEWSEEPCSRPFGFVEMTATPLRSGGSVFALDDADRADPVLGKRLRAPKPTKLVPAKGKKDDQAALARALVAEARAQAEAAGARRVAVVCNRIRTARLAWAELGKAGLAADLVIGRMRPLDRDDLYRARLAPLRSGVRRAGDEGTRFVVATQCLEVGADLDFDVLVSEVASLDALLQRFGRLNRTGDFPAARGSVVAASWQLETKKPDLIYGTAMASTWEWLAERAAEGVVEMAIEAEAGATVPMLARQLPAAELSRLVRPAVGGPVLLPAHLDTLAQTDPRPTPEPEVALFLHGIETAAAEAQVVWRADLSDKFKVNGELLALCPPSANESMPVRLGTLRRWLEGRPPSDALDTDLEGTPDEQEGRAAAGPEGPAARILVWRGSGILELYPAELRPNDTVILPAKERPAAALGHIPKGRPLDLGDEARFGLRRRATLRLNTAMFRDWGWEPPGFDLLRDAAESGDIRAANALVASWAKAAPPDRWPGTLFAAWGDLLRRRVSVHPTGDGVVLEGRFRSAWDATADAVELPKHLALVGKLAKANAQRLEPAMAVAAESAGLFHDYGKADVRFQALLRGGDHFAARFAPSQLAKSGLGVSRSAADVGLPRGFRHELLSLLMAEKAIPPDKNGRELTLHLIATHHGRCRPLPPVVLDPQPVGARYDGAEVTPEELCEVPPHDLRRGIADRFWLLLRRHGWWGLAYMEAMLRLADWQASDQADAEAEDD